MKTTLKTLIQRIRDNKDNKAVDWLINEAIEGRTCREKYAFLNRLFARSKEWAFRCPEPVFYVSKTETTYKPSIGDCDGTGEFIFEPQVYTLEEVMHLCNHELGSYENLQIGPFSQSLYEIDGTTDYRTSELTSACLHIDGTPDGLWLISMLLGNKLQLKAA